MASSIKILSANRIKRFQTILILILFISASVRSNNDNQSWIRINQLGYLPHSNKVAVLCSKENTDCQYFSIREVLTDSVVYKSDNVNAYGPYGSFLTSFRLDFTEYQIDGNYYVEASGIRSPAFRIDNNIYDGTADFLLNYMRQQRCGFNPFLNDSCHTNDGFTIYGPMPDSTHIDVTGGWHDASDYLQYLATSANATYNMLIASRDYPDVFNDQYEANGLPGSNGIIDVLDEANWGLEWMLKMFPRDDWMFVQIADDRDHTQFKLPNRDSISYGRGFERPVYFNSGEPQGIFKYKNRTEGTSSSAGKFASAFALASELFSENDKKYSSFLQQKAQAAYEFGKTKPGFTNTAPCRAPYYYEEENWADDMELAGAAIFNLTGENEYYAEAVDFSKIENITPWMGNDTARHYQWYPFLNIGHYELGRDADRSDRELLADYYRRGIDTIYDKGKDNAFLMGVPFIWCSNNLVSAFVTQCLLYRNMTGDLRYADIETSMRDWLFGCNPWGTSMIIGLPDGGVYPKDPHSAFTHLYNYPIDGGLIDGPVYSSIYKNLKYVSLAEEDEFSQFQSDLVVYHDDWGDYATNEPTMDGTASLIYYLAAMQSESGQASENTFDKFGAVIRGRDNQKDISLIFSAHDYNEGKDLIQEVLDEHKVKASFFFTGDFYRDADNEIFINNLIKSGHYLGAHSDKHLLYIPWEDRDSLLVNKEQFKNDILNNFEVMKKFNIEKDSVKYFLPPYEWYNEDIVNWSGELDLTTINFTPGLRTPADYTYPSMNDRYISSYKIFDQLIEHETSANNGLNGYIILIHAGTNPERTDKFYYKLDELIKNLKSKGYEFHRIDNLLTNER